MKNINYANTHDYGEMMNIQNLQGKWKAGWSLDLHTIKSIPLDGNHFDTTYTKIGKALNMLKYHDDYTQVDFLVESIVEFLNTRLVTPYIDVILSVPPSTTRQIQPVELLSEKVSESLNIPYDMSYLCKIKGTEQIKSIANKLDKEKILKGAFGVSDLRYTGKKVLLLDDLFCTGSTLNEVTDTLYNDGNIQNVYVTTITKTRVKK